MGDSPIIGAGLYVDDTAGAAGGTGVGEEIWRISAAHLMVEAMRAGYNAQAATDAAVKRLNEVAERRGRKAASAGFLAIDRDGNVGGSCSAGTDFPYAVAVGGRVEMRRG